MITKEQALQLKYRDEIHFKLCKVDISQFGAIQITTVKARINGKVKTWKRQPDRFEVPIKHGLYESGYLNDTNADQFHLASECGIETSPWLKMICTPIIGNANDDSELMEKLRSYIMDSTNDVQHRAGAVRRLCYVVGERPPRIPNEDLIRWDVAAFVEDCFENDFTQVLRFYPNFNTKDIAV